MSLWSQITEAISAATGRDFDLKGRLPRGGGCINETLMLEGRGERYFLKLNRPERLAMFEAEREGLEALADCGAVRVPRPIVSGRHTDASYLVMEFVDMRGDSDPALFGEQLAEQHRCRADRFGWHRDNTIGSTPQVNDWSDDWVAFWREHRLGYQLDLAAQNGHPGLRERGQRLLETFPALFADHHPGPSLLHGDLWGGNHAGDENDRPVIFDPAVYYGDREADLAMTELFGGFPRRFYHAYDHHWPLDPGYDVRKRLYNLYHVLNHLNLFGGGYAGQSERLIDGLLAEIG